MTRPLVWLDLCSGLGGASQPALDRGWKVIRIDIDPRFKPDIVADVRALPLKPFHVDVLWASPPCDDFTRWGQPETWYFPHHGRTAIRKYPTTDLIEAVLKAKDGINPEWWILENVWASRPFISKIAGPVRAMVPGHAFWGRLPGMIPQTKAHKWMLSPTKDPRERSAKRAKIPYEIGEAICRAVENRTEQDAVEAWHEEGRDGISS